MNTLQLKQMLVQKIELIQDDSYLLAINTLIDSSINANKVFILIQLNTVQFQMLVFILPYLKFHK